MATVITNILTQIAAYIVNEASNAAYRYVTTSVRQLVSSFSPRLANLLIDSSDVNRQQTQPSFVDELDPHAMYIHPPKETSKKKQAKRRGRRDFKKEPSAGELECKRVLEKLFNVEFVNTRPSWLRNRRCNKLEIDCYNAKLKIGLEYQGKQHYEYVPFFHKSIKDLERQKEHDQIKRDLCRKRGVLLIEIKYTTKLKDIENKIIKKLRRGGVDI